MGHPPHSTVAAESASWNIAPIRNGLESLDVAFGAVTSPDPSVDLDEVVGGPWLSGRSTAAATWALFTGLLLLMVGNGLNSATLGVRANSEGFGLAVTGIVMASYYVGFLVGSQYVVQALTTVGHIRVFAAFASTASTAVLIHAVSVTPVTWALMRFLFGLCIAGLYVVVESWLNDLATNDTRSRLLAVYMVVSLGGLAGGQLLLGVADTNGFRLFVLSSVLVSMSLVPVSLSARSTPPLRIPAPISLRELLGVVPTGVVGSFWVGASHGTMFAMAAVYGSNQGLEPGRIAVFIAAPLVGAVLFQWPVGLVADRLPRRGVILAVAAIAAVTAALLVMIDADSNAAVALMFLLGGASIPLYSLVLAYANDWVSPDQAVGLSAALIRMNGAGSIVGPLVAAALMAAFDPDFFFVTLIGTHLTVGVYVLYRIVVAEAMPVERQRRFVAFPARAGILASSLLPRRRNPRARRDGSDGFQEPRE